MTEGWPQRSGQAWKTRSALLAGWMGMILALLPFVLAGVTQRKLPGWVVVPALIAAILMVAGGFPSIPYLRSGGPLRIYPLVWSALPRKAVGCAVQQCIAADEVRRQWTPLAANAVVGRQVKRDVGAALYIALDEPVADLDGTVDGKALSRADSELAKLALQLGVRPLMDFFSMSRKQFEAEAEHFNTLAGLSNVAPHEEEWFTADEGLRTIRALIAHVESNPDALPYSGSVLSDLEAFAYVLEEARKRSIRWHLCVDY